ncbi:MAG: M48 family metallopeptidase [Candidatus Omnitrophica bacterium]|nr:M48 family metallopeptidase [Candidatus Omnitrophota bacterium]
MKKNLWLNCGFFLLVFFSISCLTVPLTGRRQIAFIPEQTMLSMSYAEYGDFLKNNKLSTDQVQVQRVKSVGARIQKAVEKYMADSGLSDRLNNYRWEFNLVESDEVNAWCMSGGKVVVYTGLLPVAVDDNGLAVVMAHEIAHAIAKHGEERMSQGLISNLGEYALSSALKKEPEKTKQLWMTAFGLGAQYGVLLPYSRLHETEADHLGLIFMAMAGYDPKGAVSFWERMAKLKGNNNSLEFLSTHPSDQTRIENIKKQLPEAMTYFK